MMGLAIDLAMDEERSEVFLAMTDEEGMSVEGLLDAADLDDLIQRLGVMRAALADAVPERLEPSARVAAIADPAWWPTTPARPGRGLLQICCAIGTGCATSSGRSARRRWSGASTTCSRPKTR